MRAPGFSEQRLPQIAHSPDALRCGIHAKLLHPHAPLDFLPPDGCGEVRPTTVTFHEVREFVKELRPPHPSTPNTFKDIHVAFALLYPSMWLQDDYAGKPSENSRRMYEHRY